MQNTPSWQGACVAIVLHATRTTCVLYVDMSLSNLLTPWAGRHQPRRTGNRGKGGRRGSSLSAVGSSAIWSRLIWPVHNRSMLSLSACDGIHIVSHSSLSPGLLTCEAANDATWGTGCMPIPRRITGLASGEPPGPRITYADMKNWCSVASYSPVLIMKESLALVVDGCAASCSV
eukprot:351893-Chlamydomonas_euryale.AAC.14